MAIQYNNIREMSEESGAEFLPLGTMNIVGWISLACGRLCILLEDVQHILGLYTFEASSVSSCEKQTTSDTWKHPGAQWRDEIPPG